MERDKIIDVFSTLPLGNKRLISGRRGKRCYCAIGALLKSLGVDDEELWQCREMKPYQLVQRYQETLHEHFGLTRNEMLDFIEEADDEIDPDRVRRRLLRLLRTP